MAPYETPLPLNLESESCDLEAVVDVLVFIIVWLVVALGGGGGQGAPLKKGLWSLSGVIWSGMFLKKIVFKRLPKQIFFYEN